MVIPTVVLKILGGAVAVGALASSVAVPTALSMNASFEVVLHGFPEGKKQDFKDKCQLLKKEEDGGKRVEDLLYLLVCDKDNNSVAEFYYYSSSGSDLQKFNSLESDGAAGSNQTKVRVKQEGQTRVGGGGAVFTAYKGDWEDLIGKELKDCSITKNGDENKRWSLKCPKEGTSKEIPLTPVII